MDRIITIYERYALAKLSEHLTSFLVIKSSDIIWLSNMFDIREYQDIDKQLLLLITKDIDKENLFNYLLIIYVNHSSTFPQIMEELLQKFFKGFHLQVSENVELKGPQYKKIIETVKNTISRDLEILGYEMQLNFHFQTLDFVKVRLISREISKIRRTERTKLFNILEGKFKHEYEALKGAYERYSEGGADAYRQAIDSCRNAYENFFKMITGTKKWKDNLNRILKSTTITNLIKNVYSYLSGYGTHSPKQRKKEDAFLAIRLTEDIMIRVLIELKLW